MTFRLATVAGEAGPDPVIVIGDRCWALADVAPDLLDGTGAHGLLAVLQRWEVASGRLRVLAQSLGAGTARPGRPWDAAAHPPLAPILFPPKVICTGGNYRDHVAEIGLAQADKATARPIFFFKPPTTAVVGAGRSIRYPRGVAQFDWEIELAVVIGRRARCLDVAGALEAVAGYSIGLDLSARDLQFHPGNAGRMDVFGGKAFDDSCPLGPWIVPAWDVPDPQALALHLSVNGVTRQSSSTSHMIWSVAEQVAAISHVLTLEPGDVILTGTPSGAGMVSGQFLRPGDRITAEISGIGQLNLEVVDA